MRQRSSNSSGNAAKSLAKASDLSNSNAAEKISAYPPENWETTLVSCGSNAFGQLHHLPISGFGGGLGGDLMSSLLRSTSLPLHPDGALRVEALACGTNISAAIVCHESDLGLDYRKTVCYLWGAGLPGPPLRVPTPLSIIDVKQISCGHTHCGLVTEGGLAFTWGAGDQGMLGHGNRQTVMNPKPVSALNKMKALSISCGAYHTAIIACEASDLQSSWMTVPIATASSPGKAGKRYDEDSGSEHSFQCGCLYTFGMNKVGQLGHASGPSPSNSSSGSSKHNSKDFVLSPRRLAYFDGDTGEGGSDVPYVVAKVSCGMHHTLMLCVPSKGAGSHRNSYTTAVFSCGWGEHGRLGTGDEEQRGEPCRVEFPPSSFPFCATDIAAGEQHSLAAGTGGAYSWGSNSMGQLGIGSPSTTEMTLVPMRIPLPEGMEVIQLAAGGRHSAAITRCGKLLSWGWGEDGQLGGGNEKNAAYPRPVRIPKLRNDLSKGVPVAVAVGMSHTMVVLRNDGHIVPTPKPLPVIQEITEPPSTPPVVVIAPPPVVEEPVIAPIPEPVPKPCIAEVKEQPLPEQGPRKKKTGLLSDDGDQGQSQTPPMLTTVRSIRELLQQRDRGGGESPRPQTAASESEPVPDEAQPPDTSFTFFMTEG